MKHLFVYGTLIPGQAPSCVADIVSRFRVVGPATVAGQLHSLGSYPGLILDSGDTVVRGTLCELPDDNLLWRRLDHYEGYDPSSPTTSLFRRVTAVATLADGRTVDCQTYVYNRPVRPASLLASGDWLNRTAPPAVPARATTDPADFPMKRPLIGITSGSSDNNPSRYETPSDYAASVERAGGLPLMLPFRSELSLIPELLDRLDGLVFVGGDDLDPALYGERWHPKAVPVDPQRQTFELALLAEAERRRMPILGICLGSQLLNVHRGGSLHQFLPDVDRADAIEHRHQGDHSYRHPVTIARGTVLAEVLGCDTLDVNSRHKQAVRDLGRGLRPSAVAPDGVIEAFEDPDLPLFLAIQWHPENLTLTSTQHLALFERLVKVALADREVAAG